jgi:hypothetical protein
MAHPLRVQRSRQRKNACPPGTIYVGRPSKWGNPFAVNLNVGMTLEKVLDLYRHYITKARAYNGNCAEPYRGLNLEDLRGHHLACWCPLDKPCHADILCELANRAAP